MLLLSDRISNMGQQCCVTSGDSQRDQVHDMRNRSRHQRSKTALHAPSVMENLNSTYSAPLQLINKESFLSDH